MALLKQTKSCVGKTHCPPRPVRLQHDSQFASGMLWFVAIVEACVLTGRWWWRGLLGGVDNASKTLSETMRNWPLALPETLA
ncbi:hypothetical protein EJ02DRAFT_173016 [Clathrospora elynae]|uniref:Uncharacterized protein n=1 Tax=Clathrospora elynae TaxID=706981 RepID=A0A6A5T4I5_9PLEO|nr:hypothetical protein EJ02DRAFT_173016 [Clathrospora elynae]